MVHCSFHRLGPYTYCSIFADCSLYTLLSLPYSYLYRSHYFWICSFCMLKSSYFLTASCLCLNYFSHRKQRAGRSESPFCLDSPPWSMFKHLTVLHFQAEQSRMAPLCQLCRRAGVFSSVLTAEPLSTFPVPFLISSTPIVPNLTGEGSIMLFGSVLTCSTPCVHCLSWRFSFPSARQPHGPVVLGISLNGNVMCVRVCLVCHQVCTFWLFFTFRDWTGLSQYLLRNVLLETTSGEPTSGFSPEPIHGFQILSLWQLRGWISSRAAGDR